MSRKLDQVAMMRRGQDKYASGIWEESSQHVDEFRSPHDTVVEVVSS